MKLLFASILLSLFLGCNSNSSNYGEVIQYPMDDLSDIIDPSAVTIDPSSSTDGGGSLMITVTDSTVVHLFDAGDVDAEKCKLVYSAKVRTENALGNVYLEMWCRFADQGYYFSRSMNNLVSGTTNWAIIETPFYLNKGENPDNVRLNIVSTDAGTVWVDDIKLIKKPLK